MLSEFLNGKILNKHINPDETDAYKSAFEADILTGKRRFKSFSSSTLHNSMKIETGRGAMINIVNTNIPTKQF